MSNSYLYAIYKCHRKCINSTRRLTGDVDGPYPINWFTTLEAHQFYLRNLNYLVALSRQSKLFFTNVLILIAAFVITVIASTHIDAANAAPSHLTFGCLKVGQALQCDPMTNKFDSISVTGRVERVSTINLTKVDPVEGVFGNAKCTCSNSRTT